MEEHYINDVGKITYVYGVNLEEHKTMIEKQQKRIAELEQELAELKEKAIVPKFKVGQECYYVYTKSQLRPFNVKIGRTTFDTDRKNKIMYDSDFEDDDSYFEKYYGMKECNLFDTEQEAQAKLKEIQGNE